MRYEANFLFLKLDYVKFKYTVTFHVFQLRVKNTAKLHKQSTGMFFRSKYVSFGTVCRKEKKLELIETLTGHSCR